MDKPEFEKRLKEALVDAASAHHEYEESYLGGTRDEAWAGFYAAFVLGRLGDFMAPSRLTGLLGDVEGDPWVDRAVRDVTAHLPSTRN